MNLLMESNRNKNMRKREKSFSEGIGESIKKKVKFDLPVHHNSQDKTQVCERTFGNPIQNSCSDKYEELEEPKDELKTISGSDSINETKSFKDVTNTNTSFQAKGLLASRRSRVKARSNECVFKIRVPIARPKNNRTKRKLSAETSFKPLQKKSRLTTTSPQNEVIDKQEAQLENPRADQRKKHFDFDSNIPKIDSRCRRTSVPTAELARLKHLVHDQENQILFLQNQMDNTEPHSLTLDMVKQIGDRDSFRDFQKFPPAMDRRCFSLEPSSLHGYSSLSLNSFGNEAPNEVRLIEENESLKSELQDVKDQVELLEFRIFEYTEADPKDATQINLEPSSTTVDSSEKDALRSRRSSCSSILETHIGQTCTTPLLSAASDALRKDPHLNIDNSSPLKDGASPVNMDRIPSTHSHPLTNGQGKLIDTLNEVLINLEASALQPNNSNEEYLSMVEKLLSTISSLGELDDQLNVLMKENKSLHETVASLNESHETRTEASGTESELVHGKSPSVSSDLSDTECDFQARELMKNTSIDAAISFQESGIFDSPNEFTEAATQTSEMDEESKEIRLQEALDRLSSLQACIQGKSNEELKFHDLQESDEYLLKDQKKYILISRQEYDNMHEQEQELLHKIQQATDENQRNKDHIDILERKVKHFESKAYSEETEVMKGAVKALQERLASSERFKEQFFEEKCEYEEAENDARLMAQRLQGQLDAAQEMESLLSASLSQEQEFCRDLQRRLREYQEFEKESSEREEEFLSRLNKTNEDYANLMLNFENVRSQYSMCLFVMLLSNYWKQNIIRSSQTKEIVPYSPCLAALNSKVLGNFPSLETSMDQSTLAHSLVRNLETLEEMQTDDVTVASESLQSTLTSRPTQDGVNCEFGMTDRENYYLEQIQMLQHEKKSLRNDFETGQAEDHYKMMNLKTDLESRKESLQQCQEEKCKLMLRLQEAEYLLSEVDEKHNQRFQQLKHEYNDFINGLRHEHEVVTSQYEKRVQELKNFCNSKEQNLSDLLKQQTNIQLELAPYLQQLSCSDSYHEDQMDNYVGRGHTVVELVRELAKTASSLRERNFELQEKESAYMETINEADKIMSSHVNAYTKQIEQMEEELQHKTNSLLKVEELISSFKNDVADSYKNDGQFLGRLGDLMDEYEIILGTSSLSSDKLCASGLLRKSQGHEKSVDNEFWEKDQLLQKLMKLTSENNTLKSQLQETHDGTRRLNEAQQSINFLKGRLEELEMVESVLTEDRNKLESKLIQKERKWNDKVSSLESELSSLKLKAEQSDIEVSRLKSLEFSQKTEIDSLRSEINMLNSELKENSDETVNFESQHRNEVAKLRTQLKLVNSQLAEIGAINGDLREKLSSCEKSLNEADLQLTERNKQHENDMLTLNLKLTDKDTRIEELEAQLQQISHSSATNELDFFFSLPASSVQESLITIGEGLRNCPSCKEKLSSNIQNLMDASSSVSRVINGRLHSDENSLMKCDNDTSGKETWSTDGIGLSEDNTSESVDDIGDSYNNNDLKPAAPPRPRRDAKKKRKVKKSSKYDNSLLQELKDSAIGDDIYWKMPKESLAILNEMRNKVVELEDTISQKEGEIRLADSESSELHNRLMKEDAVIKEKTKEVEELKSSLSALRGELVKTVEEHERGRQNLVERHKDEQDSLNKKIHYLQNQIQEMRCKSNEKNVLVNILLKTILIYVKQDGAELTVAVKNIANEAKSSEFEEHTIDSICNVLSVVLKRPSTKSPTREKSTESSTRKKDNTIASAQPKAGSSTSRDSSVISSKNSDKTTLTRIPSLKVDAIVTKTSTNHNLFSCYPKSKIPRWTNLPNLFKKNPPKSPVSDGSSSKFATFSKASSRRLRRSLTCSRVPDKNRLLQASSSKTESTINERKPYAEDIIASRAAPTKPIEPHPIKKIPIIKSKSYNSVITQRRLSDSARALISQESSGPSVNVPRPQNLKITRRVGVDGVVIAWDPIENGIAGFQVTVEGRLVQQVRSPKRTKALVNGLPFPDGFTIGLVTVSTTGLCSCPALVSYKRSSAYKFPRSHKENAWGSQQKCIPACF